MYLFDNNYNKVYIKDEVGVEIPLFFSSNIEVKTSGRISIIDYWDEPTIYANALYCLQINKIELENSISSSYYAFKQGDGVTLTIYGIGKQYGGTYQGYDIYLKGIASTDLENMKSSLLIDETIILYFKPTSGNAMNFDIRIDRGLNSRVTSATLKSADIKLYKVTS